MDAYPLQRIDDSLQLLGNQQWFSMMDLASGYWQVAMPRPRLTNGPGIVWNAVVPMFGLPG